MANANDPKDSFDERYDAVMSPKAEVEQTGETVAPTEQTVTAPTSTGEVQKTQEAVQKPETDKGFANHPAWQEREAKLKEAREALQAKQAEADRYAKLLDELQKRQTTSAEGKQAQALSIAERACKRKGWDITRLSPEQRDIVNDQVELMMGVIEERETEQKVEMDKRFAPLEQAQARWEQEQAMAKAESKWSSLAGEDKLDVKVVQEAINKYCLELDKTDPQRQIKLSDEDLYYRATRPLLREKEVSQARQEARNDVKANARPLGKTPGTAVKSGPQTNKKNEDEYMDELLNKHGVTN